MKIIHTSDWHIGRTLGEKSLLDDQSFILTQFLEIIKREKPDVILIAGDIYDRSVPSKEALQLADDVFSEIILSCRIPMIVIGGNHDGRERLEFSGGILAKQGLHMAGRYTEPVSPVTLSDTRGEVTFWPVPFVKPVEYRHLAGDQESRDYNAMYKQITEKIKGQMDPKKRNILITHGLILSTGEDAETIDDSVRPIEVGGIDFASAAIFEDFDYVALGHLHRPQRVGKEEVRYAGSLLKYSFSEWNQKKSVTIIELGKKGDVHIKTEDLIPKRNLRVIAGKIAELTEISAYDNENRDDFIKIVLTDDRMQINAMDKLRQIYPNVLELTYANLADEHYRQNSKKAIKEKISKPTTLFEDFYTFIYNRPMNTEESAIVSRVMGDVEREL